MKATKAAKVMVHGFVIESCYPVPQDTTGISREVLSAMKDGDSILVKMADREVWRRAALHMGISLCTRAVGEKHARLWRVATPARSGRPSGKIASKGKTK